MSATNSTTHYELPSFLGSDKPAWLVDWNGAMATIDSAIYEAKQAADTAGTSATAVASDLATLSGTVSTQGSTISTLSETLTTAVGNINTINSLIGNGTPTTTDQTIIGAINEINANVTDDSTPGTLANEVASLTDESTNIGGTVLGDGVHYLRVGRVVTLFIMSTTPNADTDYHELATLPDELLPATDVLAAGYNSGNSLTLIRIRNSDKKVAAAVMTANTTVRATITYLTA